MNVILQLIVKIFQAIFEEDAAKRPGRPAPGPPPKPGTGQQDPDSVLADFFRELQGGQQAPPPTPKQRAAKRARSARPPAPQRQESYQEHLRKQEAHITELDARAHGLADHAERHLGVDVDPSAGPAKRKRKLPGKTTLEQMIYAGVILGPCRAKQPRGRLL